MSTYQTKAGLNRSGSQRYRCHTCGRVYTPAPRPLGFSMEVRERALQLYLEGKSQRSIARTMNVSSKTVSRWVVEHRIQFSQISVKESLEVVPMQEQPASAD